MDGVRPDGIGGPLVLVGAGRDLATGVDGNAYLVDAAATSVVVAPAPARTITQVFAEPGVDGIGALVGERAGSGFRRTLAAALPDLVSGGSLVHQLLDETPAATLISAAVPTRLGAGWSEGGSISRAVAETGVPLVAWGPLAPSLDRDDDDLAWHPVDPLPPHSMRRRRLIDVWRGVGPDGRSASAPVRVEVRFRDTFGEEDGTETVVHEYGLTLRLDPDAWTVAEVKVAPGPLPAPECPSAASSGERLVGESVDGLRSKVRDELTGTTTCTHLNDTFRSLADVPHLWASASPSRAEGPIP